MTKKSKPRSQPALVANLRRGGPMEGRRKRDILDEIEGDWEAYAFCDNDGKDYSCTYCGALPDEECRG